MFDNDTGWISAHDETNGCVRISLGGHKRGDIDMCDLTYPRARLRTSLSTKAVAEGEEARYQNRREPGESGQCLIPCLSS